MVQVEEFILNQRIDRQSVEFIALVDTEVFPSIKTMLTPQIRQRFCGVSFLTNASSLYIAQYHKKPNILILERKAQSNFTLRFFCLEHIELNPSIHN